MMSMAGGWFFLMITETFTLGDTDFRLAGVGSYAAEAVYQCVRAGRDDLSVTSSNQDGCGGRLDFAITCIE